ncbi:hypothetical protein [Synechococcus sp. RS9907]|uniref:hypothetical protein n=1 Tax=Synechococcus sp. RS9907 TaxID=221350 RepID=UPI00165E2575|nr:hypothetical protein [Synechococcus sp. RS9907]
MLQRAQQIRLARSRPPLWFVTGVFRGEEVPKPPEGVETFQPWIVVRIDGERPADDKGTPEGKLYSL